MSWTAEGGLKREEDNAKYERACFYDNLGTEINGSELFWTALILPIN
jgi:hypothetical protein